MTIERPWGISVRGWAEIEAEPDRARLRLAITRTTNHPASSLEEASAAVRSVRSSLRANGIEDQDVIASRTRVQTAWSGYGPDRAFIGHQCSVDFTIVIADLDAVERIVIDAIDADADEVTDLTYETSRDVEFRNEARVLAIADAADKARRYADAAGVRLGPVVHIDDVGSEYDGGRVFEVASRSAGGGELAPGSLAITATVAVGFAIIQ